MDIKFRELLNNFCELYRYTYLQSAFSDKIFQQLLESSDFESEDLRFILRLQYNLYVEVFVSYDTDLLTKKSVVFMVTKNDCVKQEDKIQFLFIRHLTNNTQEDIYSIHLNVIKHSGVKTCSSTIKTYTNQNLFFSNLISKNPYKNTYYHSNLLQKNSEYPLDQTFDNIELLFFPLGETTPVKLFGIPDKRFNNTKKNWN